MIDACKFKGEKVLLVEGKNDCHVVLALCKFHNVPEVFGIHECENDEGVLRRLNALIPSPEPPKTIGVILDADNPNVLSRWRQIKAKINDHGYRFPDKPDQEGTILQGNSDKPTVGIWLMPNNQDPGMLEDFLLDMADSDAISIANNCIENAQKAQVTYFKAQHYSKALVHTYLAWQDEPGKPLGQSITSHVLQPQTEIAQLFVNWLIKLFK